MKTPIVYYGGKTMMLRHILPLIPKHRIYVEPFFGGGAVFFAKEPAKVEVISDRLDMCINFWQVLQTDFPALKAELKKTLHSERAWQRSREILKNPEKHTELKRAWAFWAQANLSFSHTIFGGFAFAKSPVAKTTANRVHNFQECYAKRLENVQIFCRDGLDVIKKFDSPNTFFYLDPPYPESDCGHYKKGRDVFYDLLKLLPKLKGKWLLSSYPGEQLDELRKATGANFKDYTKALSVSGKNNVGRKKTECLTWNYEAPE